MKFMLEFKKLAITNVSCRFELDLILKPGNALAMRVGVKTC